MFLNGLLSDIPIDAFNLSCYDAKKSFNRGVLIMALGGVGFMVENYSLEGTPFLQQLDHITTKIESFQNKYRKNTGAITRHDIDDLIRDLQNYTDGMNADFLESKKLSISQREKINERIEHALNAVLSFHRTQPAVVSQKNVNEMIVSLFAALTKEMDKFKATVENLEKKWKAFSSKIQETGKSKQT